MMMMHKEDGLLLDKRSEFIERLECLPELERIRAALQLSSQLTEFAAYEIARAADPDFVSELILIAARLQKVSAQLQNS